MRPVTDAPNSNELLAQIDRLARKVPSRGLQRCVPFASEAPADYRPPTVVSRLNRGDTYRPYGLPEVHRVIRACRWLSDRAKLVWTVLVDHQGVSGGCYPSNELIGQEIGGVSERRVRGYITELEQHRLIRRRPRLNAKGRRTSNEIEFLWVPLEELSWDAGVLPRGASPDAGVRGREDKSGALSPDAGVLRTKSIERSHIERTQESPDASVLPTQRRVEIFNEDRWEGTGWKGLEEFETWWSGMVRKHPNKNRNGLAKTKAIDLIEQRVLKRGEFELGYSALAAANADRWTEQNGRFATNLWDLLEDRLWQHSGDEEQVCSAPRLLA